MRARVPACLSACMRTCVPAFVRARVHACVRKLCVGRYVCVCLSTCLSLSLMVLRANGSVRASAYLCLCRVAPTEFSGLIWAPQDPFLLLFQTNVPIGSPNRQCFMRLGWGSFKYFLGSDIEINQPPSMKYWLDVFEWAIPSQR